jgi:hypothetical protein
VIDDRGDSVVGRDLEEMRLKLLALADIDRVDAIGKAISSSAIETLRPFGVLQV